VPHTSDGGDDESSKKTNRRRFLAGAGAGLLAATPVVLGGNVSAQGENNTTAGGSGNGTDMQSGGSNGTDMGNGGGNEGGNGNGNENGGSSRSDVEILNYALTLEHLENEFYKQHLEKFDERDFQRSDLLDEFGFGTRFTARDYIRDIQEHEQAHVDFLTTAIENAGGTPVTAASEYNFGAPLGQDSLETVVDFAAVAQVLEATGVDAYAGAAPEISNAAYIPPALSIHSVEANHAAYLRNLNGENPMPTAFNEAKSIDTVLETVGPIIVAE
jgi:rubrerythrin